VVEATLRRDGDAATVEFAGHRLAVPADVLAGHPGMSSIRGDARVIVGVRPESISDASEAPELPADGRIEAVPTLCEAIGSDVYVHFTIDAPAVLTEDIEELAADTGVEALEELRAKAAENRSEWVGRVSPRSRAAEGESITLVIDTRQLHFFDADSGEAL
jgi:multiple sugar transport system ATP-binding protein